MRMIDCISKQNRTQVQSITNSVSQCQVTIMANVDETDYRIQSLIEQISNLRSILSSYIEINRELNHGEISYTTADNQISILLERLKQ